jgi:hypothetical protein
MHYGFESSYCDFIVGALCASEDVILVNSYTWKNCLAFLQSSAGQVFPPRLSVLAPSAESKCSKTGCSPPLLLLRLSALLTSNRRFIEIDNSRRSGPRAGEVKGAKDGPTARDARSVARADVGKGLAESESF